jgi:hypothetical protein
MVFAAVHESVPGRFCCKTILDIRARKILPRLSADAQRWIQKCIRCDTIVARFYSTDELRRLLQQNLHIASFAALQRYGRSWGMSGLISDFAKPTLLPSRPGPATKIAGALFRTQLDQIRGGVLI